MDEVRDIMIAFADETGLSNSKNAQRRYLWTDAFAVCNYLTLYRQLGDEDFKQLARDLIDQVHNVLGRHRADDPRTGWISGLDEEKGQNHPTACGLRIGKRLNERRSDDHFDERLEWERDGQYFHYLTKWMHALERAAAVTCDPNYCRWSVELAKAAHARFTYDSPARAEKRMHSKMSIDLTRPLIPSMGMHDPLDGFVTYNELRICTDSHSGTPIAAGLGEEIGELATMCQDQTWETGDPLGIGGLLFDTCRVFQLEIQDYLRAPGLLKALLDSSRIGLIAFVRQYPLHAQADHRLAFRELGLSIGLKTIPKIQAILESNADSLYGRFSQQIADLEHYLPLGEAIDEFWRNPDNQKTKNWMDHRDINMVMLATSLSPHEFLSI